MPMMKATPFDYEFDPDHIALICIDMQRDFCEVGGFASALGMDVALLRPCIPVIASLQAAFRKAQLPIIHTKECHTPDLSNCPTAKRQRGNPPLKIGMEGKMGRILIDGQFGSNFIDELEPQPYELVIPKPGKDAFYSTVLEDYMRIRGITQLIITGCTTEVCVQTTMRAANDRGYDCVLVEDGTGSYFPKFKESVLEQVVSQGGIIGWTAPSTQIIQTRKHLTPDKPSSYT
jgi:nicotinamidase-related amidase